MLSLLFREDYVSEEADDGPPVLVRLLIVPFCFGAIVISCVGAGVAITQMAADHIPGRH